jgi:hypothetical protein
LLFFENPSISLVMSLVGHCFGSRAITWLIHSSPAEPRIRQIVLVDPVSVLFSEPDVMCNFLHAREALQKRPRCSRIGVISNELFAEHCLRRHFAWCNSELWLEDLPVKAKVLACLSEEDQILPACKVQREVDRTMLRDADKQDVDLFVWEGAGHAHCTMRPRTWRRMQLPVVMKRQERLILEETAAAKNL